MISFIPLVGAIWLLVVTVTDGDRGENIYGPNPKEIARAKPLGFTPEQGKPVYSPVMNSSEGKNWGFRTTERIKSPDSQKDLYGWLVQLFENNKSVAFPITEELTLIGRDPGTMGGLNGIFKIVNDGTVSRKHAAIRIESKANTINFLLEDLGSANGTYVMNTRTKVQPLQPFYLTDGDKIKTGDTLLTFRTALAAPTEQAAINVAQRIPI
ncbi:hypothetical protein GCM10023188_36210 [Pontibacter saemangeumensis]|uniref:FHA domain-containing protein n=2 Tax=Pontibacter saemangeumensis TaxID=1084525 RepID=A0ABP8LZM2_9BACT